jgi:hypothetical protein
MRKKNIPPPEKELVVVDEQILRSAKLALEAERPRTATRCVICGAEAAPTSNEDLCWVCRRLKISAWRDSDQQMTAQE